MEKNLCKSRIIKQFTIGFFLIFCLVSNVWAKNIISKGPLSDSKKRYFTVSDNVRLASEQQTTYTSKISVLNQPLLAQAVTLPLTPGYTYDLIASTQIPMQGTIPTSLGLPSINDSGKVAFTAQISTDGRPTIKLIDYDNNQTVRTFFMGNPFRVGNFVQVNNSDHIAFYSKTDDNLVTKLQRLDTLSSGVTIGSGSLGPAFGDFDVVFPYSTINNNDLVAFTGQISNNTYLASRSAGEGPFNVAPPISSPVTIFPMISDLGETVVLYGNTQTSPLLYSSQDFSYRAFLASTTQAGGINTRFSAIGNKPGISQDGDVIAFMARHPTLGNGVYIYIWDNASNVYRGPLNIIEIPPTSSLNYRVGVNQVGTKQHLISLFSIDGSSTLGLYTIKIDITNPQLIVSSNLNLIAQVGQGLPNYSFTIQNMDSYDPVNTKGQIVFRADTNQGQVIIRVSDVNKVKWASGEPIAGAIIEGYYFAKDPQNPGNSPVITPIPGTTLSRSDGTFLMPPNFKNGTLFPNEIDSSKRGVRAKLTYNRAISGDFNTPNKKTETIINYPEWDPKLPYRKPLLGPITITFPNPVFFVPGMNGQVNSGDEDSDGKIRAFLTLDSGSTASEINTLSGQYAATSKIWKEADWKKNLTEWIAYKNTEVSGIRIPSFVYFTIPTRITPNLLLCFDGSNDQVEWGINVCMGQTDDWIKESSLNITNYFNQHVRTEIARFSPQGVDKVPFDILAHSLGGVITRNWLVAKANTAYPRISHYVTFDSPHGGVKLANSSILRMLNSFWSEARMNGISDQLNTAPVDSKLGWNYDNIIEFSEKNLLFSAENERLGFGLVPFISPDGATGTALGMGRIARPLSLFSLFDVFGSKPNGFCKRFIGGWGLQIYGEGSDPNTFATHSIQNQPIAFVSTSRFISNNKPPALGTFTNPNSAVVAPLPLNGDGICQDIDASLSAPALATLYINAMANSQSDTTVHFDHSGTVSVTAFVNSSNARVIVLNNAGTEILRSQEVESPTEGGGKVISFKIFAGSGQGKVRLISSGTPVQGKVLLGYDNDIYASISATTTNSAQNVPISIKATLLRGNGTVFKGSSPLVTVNVQNASGVETVVPVYDDGLHNDVANNDGIFGGTFTPADSGHYSLFVDFKVANTSGYIVHRSADGMVTIDSQISEKKQFKELTYLDTDGNGKPDTLDIAFDSYVYQNGSLSLSAELIVNGQVIDQLRDNVDITTIPAAPISRGKVAAANPPLVHTSHFQIPSKTLYQAAGSPITLSSIVLSDNSRSLYIDTFPDYQIPAINLSQFDVPTAPKITTVMPGFGKHAGGESITISGSNMDLVNAVYFGSQQASFIRNSNESLTATLSAWNGVQFRVDVRLVTPWNETVANGAFEYFTPNLPPQFSLLEIRV